MIFALGASAGVWVVARVGEGEVLVRGGSSEGELPVSESRGWVSPSTSPAREL